MDRKDEVEIMDISDTYVVGKRLKMSLSNDKTYPLWKGFKPQVLSIKNRVNTDFYSVQIYSSNFKEFNPNTIFENWAAVEVFDFSEIPEEMKKLIIPKGKYAVFMHFGLAKEVGKTMRFIYEIWLPESNFQLDDRLHFQVMKSDYRPDDPQAQETFWIPIK